MLNNCVRGGMHAISSGQRLPAMYVEEALPATRT